MSIKALFLIAGLLMLFKGVSAQAIDNTASFRMIDANSYVRLHYDNDYFTDTDDYYTQGINIEIVNPGYQKFLLSKLLFRSVTGTTQYGISIEHNGYTPTSIRHDNILYGDRPFAAALMLKTLSMNNDASRRLRITSALSLGMIGQAAGGHAMQKTIHHWINGVDPKGWQYQIQNDVIVNYELGIEKNIVHVSDHFLLNGFVNGRVGTLNDKFSTGIVLMTGKFNSLISSAFCSIEKLQVKNKKLRYHLYAQPMINTVAYDATLQGGLINRNSPYTFSTSAIEHITWQANFGVVTTFRSIYLEYTQSIISKEFQSGMGHRWGGIRIGVLF